MDGLKACLKAEETGDNELTLLCQIGLKPLLQTNGDRHVELNCYTKFLCYSLVEIDHNCNYEKKHEILYYI